MASDAMTASKPSAMQPGVNEQGAWPLPWLRPAMAAAQSMSRAHALLVHGPAGAGHFEFALLLAQAQLCEDPGAAPCGRCNSCRLVRNRAHPDLLILIPDALRLTLGWQAQEEEGSAKGETKASREVRVPQVRQAIDWARNTSGRGRGKALVLHSADALNATAANALLKTLEEPPGALRLFLTSTDPERLLPTVRSRCQRLALTLPTAEASLAWLQGQGVADAPALLALSSGSPMEALVLAQEGIDAGWRQQLPQRLARGDASSLRGLALPRVVEMLAKLAHDLMAVAVGAEARYFESQAMPARIDRDAWRAWHATLLRVARHDEHPWNAPLMIEALVAECASLWAKAAPAAVSRPASRPVASLHSRG